MRITLSEIRELLTPGDELVFIHKFGNGKMQRALYKFTVPPHDTVGQYDYTFEFKFEETEHEIA
jgi:hypothetical protein